MLHWVRVGLQEVVDDLIGDVDTGGVSPEMRKKVTIAVELVMNPGILFLDEPTTGLDAPSAIAVMNAVESLSRKISVLCTIHQPSAPVFAKFNYMLLLQKRGTVAFFGPTTDIQSYFERVNPSFTNSANRNLAEYALDAIAKIPGDITQAFELFKTDSAGHYSNTLELLSDSDSHSSSSEKKGLLARNSEDGKYDGGKDEGKDEGTAFIPRGTVFQQYASSFASSDWLQFTVLLTRFRVSYLQNAAGLRARLMPCIIIAIVYGTLFVQLGDNQSGATNRISLNFLVLLFAGFTANFAMSSHVSARALIFRETTSNSYKKYVYFLARTVADLPYILLEMVTFSTAIYWIAGLRNEDGDGEEFFIFVAAVFLFRMICMSVAELAASVFGDQTVAALVASLVSMMNMFFAGFLILYAEIPAYWSWMFWLSYQHYALFVMSAIELRNMVFQCPGNEGTLLVEVWDKADAGENVSCASYDPLANLAALDPNCYKSICPIQSGNTILDAYSIDYTDADIFNYLAVLAGIYAFVKVVAFVAFVNVEHIRR